MTANIIISSTGGSSGITPTELHMHRILAGDTESIRARLIPALESLQYTIITEDPLMAQRGARGWASSYMSADTLDYPIKLTVALKQVSSTIVRATFSYSVLHPWLSKGEHQTISREADAIIALATVQATATTCATCHGETTGDSRFCRFCGAPLDSAAPAELEVLRLTAGARAAHQTIISGSIFLLCGLFAPLIAIFGKGSGAIVAALVLFSLLAVPAIITLLFGMRRLHVTLNPRTTTQPALPHASAPLNLGAHTTLTPHHFATTPPRSVTEGTTELLHINQTRTTDQPLRRDERETRGDSTAA